MKASNGLAPRSKSRKWPWSEGRLWVLIIRWRTRPRDFRRCAASTSAGLGGRFHMPSSRKSNQARRARRSAISTDGARSAATRVYDCTVTTTRSRKRYLRPRSPLTRRAPGCDSRPCETPVNQFDPLDPEVIADPYPWYRWLLREAPVYHDEVNALWVLSRYDDVLAAARAPAALSSQQGVAYRRLGLPMMISMDPPDHTRLRSILSRAFTPKSLERWR